MNKKMRELLEKIQAKTETAKSFNAEGKIDEASSALTEIAELQKAYDVESQLFDIEMAKVEVPTEPQKAKDTVTEEQKSFVDFCRTAKIEKSLSAGNNGAIIPQSIANKIIEEVVELSPILSKVTMYHAKGTLSIPTYGKDGGDDVMADYAEEFTELQAHQGKFGSVDLSSKLVGALSLISKSLINNTDVDVYNFIVKKMATAISNFLERELLVGDGAAKHMTGAVTTKNLNVLTTKTIAGITADVLIDTQLLIPEAYQKGAEWYMNREVFKAIRKLKDADGNYLMTKSLVEGFGWDLLGKPVHISENMPAVAASTVPLLYGDMSGIACKLSKEIETQVLIEKYSTQHAIGIDSWLDVDSKIENAQKFVGLKMAV